MIVVTYDQFDGQLGPRPAAGPGPARPPRPARRDGSRHAPPRARHRSRPCPPALRRVDARLARHHDAISTTFGDHFRPQAAHVALTAGRAPCARSSGQSLALPGRMGDGVGVVHDVAADVAHQGADVAEPAGAEQDRVVVAARAPCPPPGPPCRGAVASLTGTPAGMRSTVSRSSRSASASASPAAWPGPARPWATDVRVGQGSPASRLVLLRACRAAAYSGGQRESPPPHEQPMQVQLAELVHGHGPAWRASSMPLLEPSASWP